MKTRIAHLVLVVLLLISASLAQAREWKYSQAGPDLAQVGKMDESKAPPRVMGLYEQGWDAGVERGDANAGKVGWFIMGLPVVTCWLPFVVEPRRPAKPPILAEEEYNSGFKFGYRAGWKNAHKTYGLIGSAVGAAAATAVILTSK
jgi:hypothetical protein